MSSFLEQLKTIFSKPRTLSESCKFLEQCFHIRMKDCQLFELALTHRSAPAKHDNERLELLGDAVLDLIVAEHVYLEFPDMDEGRLTKLKSKFISRENLTSVANKLGLTSGVTLTKQKDLNGELIIGNVLEAIFGAMYLDQGYEIAKERGIMMFSQTCSTKSLMNDLHDPKSQILEWAQKERSEVHFEIRNHSRGSFEAQLFVDGDYVSSGMAKSKKKAEKEASRIALQELKIAVE